MSWLALPPVKEVGGRGQSVPSARQRSKGFLGKGEDGSEEAAQSKEDAFPSPGSERDSSVGTTPPRRLQGKQRP